MRWKLIDRRLFRSMRPCLTGVLSNFIVTVIDV